MKFKTWQEIEFVLIQYPILFHLMSLEEVVDEFDELLRLAKTRKLIPSGQMTINVTELQMLEKVMLSEHQNTFKGEEIVYPNLIVVGKDTVNGIVSMKILKRTVEINQVVIPVMCDIEMKVFGEKVVIEKKHPQQALQFVQNMLDSSRNGLFYLGRWNNNKVQPYSQEYKALAELVCSFRVAADTFYGNVDKVEGFLISYVQQTINAPRFKKYCERLKCQWEGEFAYRLVAAYWWYLREQKNRNTLHSFICGFQSFCKNHVYETADWYLVANNGLEFNPMFFEQKPVAVINKQETDWSITDDNINEPSLAPGPSSDNGNGSVRDSFGLLVLPSMEDTWVKFIDELGENFDW